MSGGEAASLQPMIWVSILVVSVVLAGVGVSLTSEAPDVQLGAGLIIQGRVPWVLLALLWGGVALGALSMLRGRALPKLAVVVLEVVPVAFVTWYVIAGSALPAHTLAINPGDPFPAYALEDPDGALHRVAALEKRAPALYIFYRGHW